MLKKILFLGILVGSMIQAEVPTFIFTYVYNRPDFIALHVKTLKAFFKEPYEYIVFNDAPNAAMAAQIEQMCHRLQVRCLRVPNHAPNRQTASYRHMDGIKYSLKTLGFNHNGPVVMLDADMFLIKPFSIKEYMSKHDFIGGYQDRMGNGKKVMYAAPCLVLMNMAVLSNKHTINFDGDRVEGLACDVGGHTYYYFRDNPEVRVNLFFAYSKDYLTSTLHDPRDYGCDEGSAQFIMDNRREFGFQFHLDSHFLHFYAGGSNWANYAASFVQQKTDLVNQFVDEQIAYYVQKEPS